MPIRVRKPSIKLRPIRTRPHSFKKSTARRSVLLEAKCSKKPAAGPWALFRKVSEVQLGSNTFTIPSYKRCQPISIRSNTNDNICIELFLIIFIQVQILNNGFIFSIPCYNSVFQVSFISHIKSYCFFKSPVNTTTWWKIISNTV